MVKQEWVYQKELFNFGVQTPQQVKENLGSSGARAETVMDALEKARGAIPLSKTLQQIGAVDGNGR